MSQNASARAVIIGAGPGGAAAAVHLAQRGVKDVVLLDKDRFPREKTCGSALSPNGVDVIRELGIYDDVARLGYWVRDLRLKTPGNREMFLTAPEAVSVVLLRKHFDNLLVERARNLGVNFRGGFKVTELIKEGGRVVGVRGKDGTRTEEIRGDYVLCADGAHSIFSLDPRPKRTISTLMGWWEDFPIEPGTMEMIFDKNLSPLYGWMFPETNERVNIGICIDGEVAPNPLRPWEREKQPRNVRDVFQQFLDDHYRDRLRGARQIGKWKGHPISYTTWIDNVTAPGMVYLGEGVRLTHNVTGEGIYQAMQSGIYAADCVADIVQNRASEAQAYRDYLRQLRRKFTVGFAVGNALRVAMRTPLLDVVATLHNNEFVRRWGGAAISWALAGTKLDQGAGATPTPAVPSAPSAHRAAS